MDGTPVGVQGRPTSQNGSPLAFAFWDVRADIVRDNLARYIRESGDAVIAHCVAGRYDVEIEAALVAGTGPDVFYAQRAEASLWADRGLIAPLDETHPMIAPLIERMDARLVAGARDAGGRLLGLTYYNGGPFQLFLRPGRDAPIDSWEGVLDLCRKARRDREAEHPFVPRWHRTQTGLVWSLICHLATEGVTSFSEPQAETVLAECLCFYLALAAEDLVPPESLDDHGDGPALQRWALGRHSLTFTTDYLAADAAGLAGRPVSLPAFRLPGKTGTPLMPGHALICLRAGLEGDRAGRALRLAAFLGGTAADGSLAIHRRWLEGCLFAVPYRELGDDPAAQRAIRQFFPEGEAVSCVERFAAIRDRAVVSPISHQPFMLAWSAGTDALVRDDLLRHRRLSPAAAARRILDLWTGLQADHQRLSSA
jgi:hypothetical protein